jgi:hypothetical protein
MRGFSDAKAEARLSVMQTVFELDDPLADMASGLTRQRASVLIEQAAIQIACDPASRRQHVSEGFDPAPGAWQQHEQGKAAYRRVIFRLHGETAGLEGIGHTEYPPARLGIQPMKYLHHAELQPRGGKRCTDITGRKLPAGFRHEMQRQD